VLGAPIAGATALVRNETGLTAQTNYYYTLRVTDSLGASADTAQLYAPTHGTFAVRIGFIGNSQMTQSPGGETIPQAFARLFFQAYPGADPIVTNLAVSGQEARMVAQTNGGGNLLAGYLTTLATAGVTHCFVLHGGNDATQQGLGTPGYTTADYIEDMTDIVTRLAAAGITPIVCETPYRSSSPSSDAVVQIYNPLLPGICNGTTILMGDQAVYEEWFANPALYLRDGLHPTATGVVRWAQLLLAVTPLSMLPPATGFTWTGPAGGPTGVAAGPFTATPVGGKFTGTVTPNDAGGGGTWTPASRTFVGSVTAQTFTYTPAGASGTRNLSLVSSPILPAPPTLNFDTPDTTGPSFVSVTVNAAGDSLRVVWSENVNPATAVAGVTLSGGYTLGNGTRVGSPGNTVDFPITNGPVPMGTALTAGYNPTPGNLVDLAGNEQASTSGFVVDNLSTYTSDVTPPTIVSAVVDVTGTELTVTLSENCNPPTGAVGFSIGGVTLGSGVRTASPGNVYTFPILSVPIAAGVGLTLAYDQGAGNVLDLAGNEIANVSGVPVTNLVTAPPTVTGLPIPIIRIRVPELTAPITLILEGS
jgi:lysophospholipase L1-like esterase